MSRYAPAVTTETQTQVQGACGHCCTGLVRCPVCDGNDYCPRCRRCVRLQPPPYVRTTVAVAPPPPPAPPRPYQSGWSGGGGGGGLEWLLAECGARLLFAVFAVLMGAVLGGVVGAVCCGFGAGSLWGCVSTGAVIGAVLAFLSGLLNGFDPDR